MSSGRGFHTVRRILGPLSNTSSNRGGGLIASAAAAGSHRKSRKISSKSTTETYSAEERAILSAALRQVPEHGFSGTALAIGAKDAGYLEVTTNLFPLGSFEIAKYHMVCQREHLQDYRVSKPWVDLTTGKERAGTTQKIRALCLERLRQNEHIIHQWPDVSGYDVQISLEQLHHLLIGGPSASQCI
jgi:ubiquinone biosynthesis protein COQ9